MSKTSTAAAIAVALFAVQAPAIVLAQNPISEAETATQAARKVMMSDPAQAVQIAKNLELQQHKYPAGPQRNEILSRAKWIEGEATLRLGDLKGAGRLIDQAYALAKISGNPVAKADVLLSRGAIKHDRANPAGALSDYMKASDLFRQAGNQRSLSIALQYLASVYAEASDLERAERYYKQAAETYSGDPRLSLALANNLGNLFMRLERYEDAIIQFKSATKIAKTVEPGAVLMRIQSNLSRALVEMKQYPAAEQALFYAMRIADTQRIADRHELLVTSAKLAFARGQIPQALRIITQAIGGDAHDLVGSKYLETHAIAYRIYKAAGQPKVALRHLEIMREIREDMTSATISNKTALMSAQFDFASQELRIQQLRTQQLMRDVVEQREAARNQFIIFVAIAGAIAIIMSLLTFGLVTIRNSRNRIAAINKKLEQAIKEVGERQRAEQHATKLAEHDTLTGLPNRRHLYAKLFPEFQQGMRDNEECAALLLDLDRFKPVNDIYGHATGDAVLMEVANRLRTICIRHSAVPVRLGGDEFVVMLPGPADNPGAQALAEELIQVISSPYDIGDRRLLIGTSIGIARYPQDSLSIEDLLRSADIAMYEAKRLGRKTFKRFDSEMVVRICQRTQTEQDLRAALRAGDIIAHFQPIYCYRTNRITSFEALARWNHPDRGPVSPDEFIPIAEETGLIDDLTMSVLRDACRAAAQWPDHVSVSVNISPVLLRDAWITKKIFGMLATESMPANRLIIEITEHAVIDDIDVAAETIDIFRKAGIRVALDDFGKGYSSLSHLRQLDFDHIKLDASFVRGIGDGDSIKITTAVAGLAASLDLPVTAEGVENQDTADRLRDLGFSYGQGYLYGRAVPRDKATEMVTQPHGVVVPIGASMNASAAA